MSFALTMAACIGITIPAFAVGPFDTPPNRFADTVNPVLRQAKSDLRVRRTTCTSTVPPSCRFSARDVDIIVAGHGTGTGRITVAVTFRRGGETEATRLLRASMSVLGAVMVTYDPGMRASRRVDMINELGEAAFEDSEAHLDSADVHYALAFDDASRRLEIVVAPLRLAHGRRNFETETRATC